MADTKNTNGEEKKVAAPAATSSTSSTTKSKTQTYVLQRGTHNGFTEDEDGKRVRKQYVKGDRVELSDEAAKSFGNKFKSLRQLQEEAKAAEGKDEESDDGAVPEGTKVVPQNEGSDPNKTTTVPEFAPATPSTAKEVAKPEPQEPGKEPTQPKR